MTSGREITQVLLNQCVDREESKHKAICRERRRDHTDCV